MNMKKLWFPALMALLVIGFVVFGWINRQSYTDITSQPNYLEQFQVAELSETQCLSVCPRMAESLLDSPVILQVTPVGELEPHFNMSLLPLRVEAVYAGEDLVSTGDEIWLKLKGLIIEQEGGRYAEFTFVNLPKEEREYLIFLSDQVISDKGRRIFSYPETYMVSIAPVFCYEDISNVVVPVGESNTYVPYSQVADNEFFAASQTGLDAMLELKAAMLARYPR